MRTAHVKLAELRQWVRKAVEGKRLSPETGAELLRIIDDQEPR